MVSSPTEQFDYQTIVHGILRRFPGIPYYVRRPFNRFRRDVMRSSVRENSMFRIFEHAPGVYKRKYQVYKYTLNFKRQSWTERRIFETIVQEFLSDFCREVKDACMFQMSQN